MPHAVIEYSGNVAAEVLEADATDIVWGALDGSGLFQTKDIRVRSYANSDFMVGEKRQDGSFLHVSVALLEGRTPQQKQTLSQSVFDALRLRISGIDSITVDIRELAKDSYSKS